MELIINKELSDEESRMVKDAALEIVSYVELIQSYIDKHIEITEMVHLGLLVDKMEEKTEVFKKVYKLF